MKISVALATFNGGRFLREQLDSIHRQTLPPSELVICDDGSSDDTLEIVHRFAAEAPFPVVLDAHGLRLGFTPNFLRAIGRCTGDLVALCDQDDVWDERKLAVCAAPFADPAVMTVTHRVRAVEEDLKPSPLLVPPASLRGRYTLFDIEPWYSPNGMQMIFRRAAIAPWLTGEPPLSRWVWFVTETFDEWVFHAGLLLGAAVILPDVLGVWRRHGGTATVSLEVLQQHEAGAGSLRHALHSGAEAYEFRARVADSRAEFAARHPTVPGAVEYFQRLSQTFRRRVRLHDPRTPRRERLRTFGDMAARRDYRPQSRGGLGAKAALKDAFAVCRGPRTPPAAVPDAPLG